MDAAPASPRYGRLVLVPALISLAVTLLRLVGELNRWSPVLFSRDAGGAGALVGIVWLVPVFGIYFAVQLDRRGHGPASRGRAAGFAAGGLLLAFVAAALVASRLPSPPARILAINLSCALGAVVASRGWPQLAKAELAYGLAARVPVAAIMLIAMLANWGTHYELGPPGFPSMDVLPKWLWIGLLPQMVLWIAFTVIVGMLFGSVAVLLVRPRR